MMSHFLNRLIALGYAFKWLRSLCVPNNFAHARAFPNVQKFCRFSCCERALRDYEPCALLQLKTNSFQF